MKWQSIEERHIYAQLKFMVVGSAAVWTSKGYGARSPYKKAQIDTRVVKRVITHYLPRGMSQHHLAHECIMS